MPAAKICNARNSRETTKTGGANQAPWKEKEKGENVPKVR